MTGKTVTLGETIVTTAKIVINEKVVFMTDEKCLSEGLILYDEKWKAIGIVALLLLVVK